MNDQALAALNERLLSGDAERGNAVLERLLRLATVTDEQQLVAYRSETFTPRDARDFVAALAVHGIVAVARPVDEE
jgi:hypothetical protein